MELSIGDYVFDHCISLETVIIKNSDIVIRDSGPFYNCPNLKSIIIGEKEYKVECVDRYCMEILSRKELGDIEVIHTKYFNTDKESYVAKREDLAAHGATIKEAISDLTFKEMQQKNVSEHVARIKEQGYVTPDDYRLVTGACRQGTGRFLAEHGFGWDDKLSIPETLEIVKGHWGSEKFIELFS